MTVMITTTLQVFVYANIHQKVHIKHVSSLNIIYITVSLSNIMPIYQYNSSRFLLRARDLASSGL